MNPEQRRGLLKAAVRSEWSLQKWARRSEGVRWLRLLTIECHDHQLGMTENGDWVVLGGEGLVPFDRSCPGILPCLEHDRESLLRLIVERCTQIGVSSELAGTFPATEVVAAGLKSSTYWEELALGWLTAMDEKVEELVPLLQAQCASERTSQRVLHSARRILREWGIPPT